MGGGAAGFSFRVGGVGRGSLLWVGEWDPHCGPVCVGGGCEGRVGGGWGGVPIAGRMGGSRCGSGGEMIVKNIRGGEGDPPLPPLPTGVQAPGPRAEGRGAHKVGGPSNLSTGFWIPELCGSSTITKKRRSVERELRMFWMKTAHFRCGSREEGWRSSLQVGVGGDPHCGSGRESLVAGREGR